METDSYVHALFMRAAEHIDWTHTPHPKHTPEAMWQVFQNVLDEEGLTLKAERTGGVPQAE